MRIFYLLTLFIVSCYGQRNADITSYSLEDNERMVYENYIENSHKNQEKNVIEAGGAQTEGALASSHSYFINKNNDINCVYGCERTPLKIGVVPMSFSSQEALDEITNTIAFINSNVNGREFTVSIISKEELENLELFLPDVIVGPFKEEDVKEIQSILKKQNLQIPVVSLTTNVSFAGANIYYFGFANDDIIESTIASTNKLNFETYGLLMPSNAVGSATYNLFKKHIKDSGKHIARAEFYNPNEMENFAKFVSKLEISLNQNYFVAKDGSIIEDNQAFTRNIKERSGNFVVMKDGARYEKKQRKMDAIIIDSDDKNFEMIFDTIAANEKFNDVAIIGSPRIVDGVIFAMQKDKYSDVKKTVIFPANYEFYRNFYLSYLSQFGKNPTRLSTTLYETLVYLFSLHKQADITKIFNPNEVPEFAGLNGNMVVNGNKSILRYASMNEFGGNEVRELEVGELEIERN